ncbi:MAG TPA: NUDIX hydrolase [Armatimonadetes bacterium]|nr:NUDIX hydrolase [Armatimonadota bacterium]
MSRDLTERTIVSRRIYEGRVVNLRVDTVLLPNGRTSIREVVEHRGAVAIVPMLSADRVMLVRQFRKPANEHLLEIPAGTLSSDESPLECAQRELMEEIGYRAGKLERLFAFYLAPGYSTEMLHVFLATDLERERAQPEEDEFLELVEMSLDEAIEQIKAGGIRDAKTISALLLTWYRKHAGEL